MHRSAPIEAEEPGHVPPDFELFLNGLRRYKWFIIMFWLASVLWGGLTGEDYIKEAEDTANAPGGTRTYDDFEVFKRTFPEFAEEKVMIMLIECLSDNCTVVCPASKCKKGCFGENSLVAKATEAIAAEALSIPAVTSYQSYFNVSGTLLDAIKCTSASPNGKVTYASFTFSNLASNPEKHHVINTILKILIPRYNPDPALYRFSLTGFDPLAKDGSEDAILEVVRIDIFTMPVAFALLGYMVRSWRLLLLAGMNTAATMAFSFAMLAQVARWTGKKPLSTSSSLVEVLGLSLAIDYSLFLLRRFCDELKNKRSTQDAIRLALMNAGHVVVLSSLTFSCVFIGLLFLKSPDLQSLAQASLVSINTALLVCMTNTGAMLFAFPEFFSGDTDILGSCRRVKGATESDRVAQDLLEALILDEAVPSQETSAGETVGTGDAHHPPLGRTVTGKLRHRRGAKYAGCYFHFLKAITKYPFNIVFIVTVYSLSIPIALKTLDLRHNQDVSEAISRSAPSSQSFQRLSAAFPGGTLSPFYVVIESESSLLTRSEGPKLFQFLHEFVDAVGRETGANPKLAISPATLQGNRLSFSTAMSLLDQNSMFCKRVNPEGCATYQFMFERFTTTDKHAVLLMFTIDKNPYGQAGASFIQGCLRVIDSELVSRTTYKAHLSGDEVLLNADQEVAFSAMPALLGSTVTIIFILLGFGFRSFMTPLRLSLTVFLPLSTVFGFAVLVYQEGLLDFTGITSIQKREIGFFWYIPVICLLQALGLTIDYDVFTFSRIFEHRADGYEIRAAIIKSIWEVSSTICVAGLIMAAVFSGLLLGSSTAVNQFGFLLCTSVLVDTFIVQSLLVPAIVSIGDSFAWFPRPMPMNALITLDDEEFAS